jgi:hypothetical protein
LGWGILDSLFHYDKVSVKKGQLHHALCVLAGKIDWAACERQFGGLYAAGIGRPGHPIRLMVGLQLLKYLRNISDEEVVAAWPENPYWQYFCGEQYFCHDVPIDPTLMTLFRHRIGAEGCEFILGLTVQTGLATKTITGSSLSVVNVDTTVQDKAVAFPTDARLLNKARIALVKLAAQCDITPAPALHLQRPRGLCPVCPLRPRPPVQPRCRPNQEAAYHAGTGEPGHPSQE